MVLTRYHIKQKPDIDLVSKMNQEESNAEYKLAQTSQLLLLPLLLGILSQ